MQIQANGIAIEAESHGDEAGPAILLIRGLGTQMIQWPSQFLETLVEGGYRALCFDNRDVGLSQKFDERGAPALPAALAAMARGEPPDVPYTLDDMAADCVGVLDAFGALRAHIFGISMGGMIAQIVAGRHRERTRSLISVMSSSGEPGLPPATAEAMAALRSQPDDPNDLESVLDNIVQTRRAIGSPGFPDDDDVIRGDGRAAYERCYHPQGVERQMGAVVAGGSRVELLQTIDVPSLVIHGRDDPLVPLAGGESTARHIPGCELEIVDGMGHDIARALAVRLATRAIEHCRKVDG